MSRAPLGRLLAGLLVAAPLALPACDPAVQELPAPVPGPFDHGYAAWDALLARHVADGRVDYEALGRRAATAERSVAPAGTLVIR